MNNSQKKSVLRRDRGGKPARGRGRGWRGGLGCIGDGETPVVAVSTGTTTHTSSSDAPPSSACNDRRCGNMLSSTPHTSTASHSNPCATHAQAHTAIHAQSRELGTRDLTVFVPALPSPCEWSRATRVVGFGHCNPPHCLGRPGHLTST